MAGINKVILIGNLGRDPELRHTQAGTAVCTLSVATTRTWFNKATNERSEETEWHRVTVWGKDGENAAKYLTQGRQVYIEGRLKTTSYEKDGVKQYSTDVVAETVQYLGGGGSSGEQEGSQERRSGGRGQGGGAGRGEPKAGRGQSSDDDAYYQSSDDGDDGIPF